MISRDATGRSGSARAEPDGPSEDSPAPETTVVRGPRGRHDAVETLMQLIHTELQALGSTTLGSDTYDKVVATGEPFRLPVDGNERPIWTASYELWAPGP